MPDRTAHAPQEVTGSGDDIPVVTFATPLLGLGELRRFALVVLDEYGTLFSMRSLDEDGLRLLVVPTWVCATQYPIEMDEGLAAELDIRTADQAAVFLVVTPGDSLATSTVNMLAPIVVNAATGQAAQLMLTGTDYSVRAPLVPAASA